MSGPEEESTPKTYPLTLAQKEFDLLFKEHRAASPDHPLEASKGPSDKLVIHLPMEDWEVIAAMLSKRAFDETDQRIQSGLDRLIEKIEDLLDDAYDDEEPPDAP